MQALDIPDLAALLTTFPKGHIELVPCTIRQLMSGEIAVGTQVTVLGWLLRMRFNDPVRKPRLTVQVWVLQDPQAKRAQMELVQFWGGSYQKSANWRTQEQTKYQPLCAIRVTGTVDNDPRRGIKLKNPILEVVPHDYVLPTDCVLTAIYRDRSRTLPSRQMVEADGETIGRWVRRALVALGDQLPTAVGESLPGWIREQYSLLGRADAVAQIHMPTNAETLEQARRRLVFDEFFHLQLGLLSRRLQQQQSWAKAQAQAQMPQSPRKGNDLLQRFYAGLPFQLTGAQQRVIGAITADLQQPLPMSRLVQGDVGSGKTVVAAVAMLLAVQQGQQVALMAPTEVLAEQHYRDLSGWFEPLGIRVDLLTGSTTPTNRRLITNALKSSPKRWLPVVVGTHALLSEDVVFNQLGLVVIDEEHRFGVEQREQLQQKGQHPHVLTLSATPIPRTLALTLYGDKEVSVVDELPPGRKPIETKVKATATGHKSGYQLLRMELLRERQAYIVFPLVEESEHTDLRAATTEFERLQKELLQDFRLGLLHGKMTPTEKRAVLGQFQRHELDVLVSTTVIEVGVNVPNATVMLIEHAERFGLAQLHQLRGRVGRGSEKSYCLLMSHQKQENPRLKLMEQSQDGFFLAEMDMRLRGAGALLGTAQAGKLGLELADLAQDGAILEQARQAAKDLIDHRGG